MEWRHSSKPISCLEGTVGGLFSKDSWVEKSKIEQERDNVAAAWKGGSRESCELIPTPPLAACRILGKSAMCLPSLFSFACRESQSSSQFCWVTGCSKVFFWASLHSGPLVLGLQMLACAGALGTTIILIATTVSSCSPSHKCKFLEMLG